MTLHVFVLFVCFCMLTVACLCYLYWSHHNSSPSKGRLRSLVLRRLKPRSPLACPLCCRTSGGSSGQELSSRAVRPWREIKSRRGARHPRADRGLCLPKQCVPVLRDHRCADPCFGGRWEAWASRAHPDVSRPCLSNDLQRAHPHTVVSPENPLVSGSPGAECSSRRAGCVCGRACLWHRAYHHHEPFSCGRERTRSACTNAPSASW
jgi:hypothetical protein